MMDEHKLLQRITVNPEICGGKPSLSGRRPAVEHVIAMLAASDTREDNLECCRWLDPTSIQACLIYARPLVARERVESLVMGV